MSNPQNYTPGLGWNWTLDDFVLPTSGWAAKGNRIPTTATAKPSTPAKSDPYTGISAFGWWTGVAGSLLGMVGSFYSVKAQQHEAKSQALAFEHEQTMSSINARAAERRASSVLEAGRRAEHQSGLEYAQARSGARAAMAGAGVRVGSGNAAEIEASIEYARQVDALTIRGNASRDAEAARTDAVNARNRGLLAGVSARNLRGTAGTMSPASAAAGSFLRSAGGLADRWYFYRRTNAHQQLYT